ncbi:hypothetical protein BO82DRAFT_36513 [Aspergillus uvarum CBS 121591]|uniref:Uncharacterized protein n=1 Tax=Aspergillus uvarum CBS 121591 TaxID=1448315 RepID=A0A319BSK7_9EURO|nr:hypothetical protein BO82DRAFT_36513 [Aspergillus uvarum CBS 121591]PYH75347.1 hypothetical protein BO82DRAFT_36513 [Aspergillus uvarum CBS 121591]
MHPAMLTYSAPFRFVLFCFVAFRSVPLRSVAICCVPSRWHPYCFFSMLLQFIELFFFS